MYTQKNVTHLFISSNNAIANGVEVPAVARQLGFKLSGETLCSNVPLADGDEFKILYLNAKGEVQESPLLKERDVWTAVKVTPTALAPQVTHIGYNGTDGDIAETNSGNYLVTLGLKDMMKMIGNKRLYKFGETTAALTAVKSDIAIELAGSLQLNQSKDAWVRVIPNALCSAAVVPGNTFDGNVTVVNGSKWITVAGGSTYGGAIQVAVGDFVRIGAVGLGTALTNHVYKVVEVSGANDVKLDRNVSNATGTYANATADTEVIPAATALLPATLWGIQLLGNDANAPFEVGKYGANLVYFSVGVSTDFQTTPVRLTQTPAVGNGTYRQIAQLDWELQGNGREKYRIAEYPVNFIPNILSSETPDAIYNIKFQGMQTDSITGPVTELVEVIIVSVGGVATASLDLYLAGIL